MRAIVISGGGSLGAFALGALKAEINRCLFDPDILAGVSVGALIAADLASADKGAQDFYYSILKHRDIWFNLSKTENVWKKRFAWFLTAFFKKSIGTTGPLFTIVKNRVNQEGIVKSGRKLFVGAYNLNYQQYVEFTETSEDLANCIMASASYPGVFPPVKIDNCLYTDGGVVNQLPSSWVDLHGSNCSRIDLFLCNKPRVSEERKEYRKVSNLVDVLTSVVNGTYGEILWTDLFPYVQLSQENPAIDIFVHAPFEPIDKIVSGVDSLQFSSATIRKLYEIGRNTVPIHIKEYVESVTQ